jgi:hypothetical protein
VRRALAGNTKASVVKTADVANARVVLAAHASSSATKPLTSAGFLGSEGSMGGVRSAARLEPASAATPYAAAARPMVIADNAAPIAYPGRPDALSDAARERLSPLRSR